MDKIAAYETVLRRHPLWEAEYQEKEAGIAALGLGAAAKGFRSAGQAFMARPAATGIAGLYQRAGNAAASGGVQRAMSTPVGQLAKGLVMPY